MGRKHELDALREQRDHLEVEISNCTGFGYHDEARAETLRAQQQKVAAEIEALEDAGKVNCHD